jgi:solute carrier family 25 protein 38
VARADGAAALLRGAGPVLLRDAPFSGLYLAAYEALRRGAAERRPAVPPRVRDFGAALLAGAAASVLTQPADVLKTRQQMARAPGAPPATLRAVLAHAGGLRAGLLALYTGTAARVAKRALSTALTWTLYEEMGRGKAGGSSG